MYTYRYVANMWHDKLEPVRRVLSTHQMPLASGQSRAMPADSSSKPSGF